MKHPTPRIGRRSALAAPAILTLGGGRLAAQTAHLSLATAGPGSAFLPYGEGIAAVLGRSGIWLDIYQSKGSNENLDLVDASPAVLGTAFLGSALEALNGTGFAAGRRHSNIRALFPMYETAFMAAALASSGLASITSLDRRRVGCGPASGPAEDYFRALARIAGIEPSIVSGSPAEQARQLEQAGIDALWQGAFVPIPSLVAVTTKADCRVFGLADDQIAAMCRRFPFMAEASYPAGTYRGQTRPIMTVTAWNVVVAHRDLPDASAYAITRAVMSAPDLSAAGPAATSTKPVNAAKIRIVPYHPGAIRALAEFGVSVE